MKKRIIDFIKRSKFLYNIYYYVLSGMLTFMGQIIRANSRECMFLCFGGRSYGDNIKPVYEQMLEDKRFRGWKFTWAFRTPDSIDLPDNKRTIKCKVDTPSFFYHALRSKCWITNVSMQRGLNFKNKGTLYVNTWHGVPLKLIGEDIKDGTVFKVNQVEKWDLILSEGIYDAKISETAFKVSKNQVKVTGYPRNDKMFVNQQDTVRKVYQLLNLDPNKKVILYAPTYRDYNRDESGGFTFDMKLSIEKFNEILGEKYQLMVRAHGAIENNSSIGKGYTDVTLYPNVEELMMAADVLISDYSGIIFDYSLLNKPIICFIYDVEEYKRNRGFYVDVETFLPFKKCYTEDELYSAILEIDVDDSKKIAEAFRSTCGLMGADSSKKAVDAIYDALKVMQK